MLVLFHLIKPAVSLNDLRRLDALHTALDPPFLTRYACYDRIGKSALLLKTLSIPYCPSKRIAQSLQPL